MKMNFLKLLVTSSILVLSSCNKNDDEPVSGNAVGIYKLTAFNTFDAQDLNGDGNSSINQINESVCFNNSFLKLNSDNTFTLDQKGVELTIIGTSETLDCYDDGEIIGTWSVSGNNLNLNAFGETVSYSINGSTIINAMNDADYVGTDSSGNPLYLTGNVSVVYTKQ